MYCTDFCLPTATASQHYNLRSQQLNEHHTSLQGTSKIVLAHFGEGVGYTWVLGICIDIVGFMDLSMHVSVARLLGEE